MNTPLKPVRMVILKGASLIGTTQKKKKGKSNQGKKYSRPWRSTIHEYTFMENGTEGSNPIKPAPP